MRYCIALIALLLFSGCNDIVPSVQEYPQGYFTYNVISAVALHQTEPQPIDTDIVPDIVPAPDSTKHKRADCPTGGWITHGDGHKTRCPDCDPPYTAQEQLEDMRIELEELRKQVSLKRRAKLPDEGVAPAPLIVAKIPESNAPPQPLNVLLANIPNTPEKTQMQDYLQLAQIEGQISNIQQTVQEIKTIVSQPKQYGAYGPSPTSAPPLMSYGSTGSVASSSYGSTGSAYGSSYGSTGSVAVSSYAPVSYAPAPVYARRMSVPERPGHWTYPGSISSHLQSTHGVSTAGMSREQMLDLHDALHEGTANSGMYAQPARRASYTYSSDCPGGNCPTGGGASYSYSRRGGGLLGFGFFGR